LFFAANSVAGVRIVVVVICWSVVETEILPPVSAPMHSYS
jgi:hypothetical protein